MAAKGGGEGWWWWAGASTAQLAAGVAWYRRGCSEGTAMPFKAFAVATLFVGAGATAVAAAAAAAGVRKVDDMKEAGLSIRRWIRTSPAKKD